MSVKTEAHGNESSPELKPATPPAGPQAVFLMRRQNTGLADWVRSLAPADARRAVLKKADLLASKSTDTQVQQLSASLVSDSYGGPLSAEMIHRAREVYNAKYFVWFSG